MSSQPETARIVVGVDGSPSSRQALAWAARLAPVLQARIEAVTAWQLPASYGWGLAVPQDWRPDVQADEILAEAIGTVFPDGAPSGLTRTIREGHPAAVLLAAGRGAAMLIVGSRGLGGFKGMLLGSVSATCAEHAGCPVLVVHDGPPGHQ